MHPSQTNPRKYEIEEFIQDWHWDEKSHTMSFEMGAFLFGFFDSLYESKLSDKTITKHESNVWGIGYLTCNYGYLKGFSPDIFKSPPFHEIEFKRKFRDSASALQSYASTCNKLAKYVQQEGWKLLPDYDFELSDDIDDFCVGLSLLKDETGRGKHKQAIDFSTQAKAIVESYVVELHDVNSRDEFLERMGLCYETLQAVAEQLSSLRFEDDYFRTKISAQLKEDALYILEIIEMTMMNI
jgi:hypothetical protein